jgi:carbonic anhydrase/acetyltransferase-like protein (isoleucine patch superfamily)
MTAIAKSARLPTLVSMSQSTPHTLPYAGVTPSFASRPVYAGVAAAVLGRVTIGRNAWLGAFGVIRADGHFVRVGDDFHLGSRSTLHINHEIFPCIVGDRVSVGRNACVHACTVGSDVVVGDGVVILDGATVEDNVVLEPGSTVFPNKTVPGGFVFAGSPAKPLRPLAAGEVAELRTKMARDREAGTVTLPCSAIAAASQLHPSAFIASTAAVKGRLLAAEASSIWYSNDFDAGDAAISIGARTNVQDNTTIRCSTSQGVSIGHDSTVGHNVTLEDCTIGDRSLIGIGSVVAKGTVVEDRVLLAAAARTVPGQVLESGWMYGGSPARQLSRLDEGKHALIDIIIGQYCQYARDFLALERQRRADGRQSK